MGAPASVRKVVNSVGLVLLRRGVSGMSQYSLGGVLFLDIHQVLPNFWEDLDAIQAIFTHGRIHEPLVSFVIRAEQLVVSDELRRRISAIGVVVPELNSLSFSSCYGLLFSRREVCDRDGIRLHGEHGLW
jgi:hypothetical protein